MTEASDSGSKEPETISFTLRCSSTPRCTSDNLAKDSRGYMYTKKSLCALAAAWLEAIQKHGRGAAPLSRSV